MTASSAAVIALIADDDPADPILAVAFQQARDHGAPVYALQYWPTVSDGALAQRERSLFERLAFYQQRYPDLYTTAETVDDTTQVTARTRSACLTVIGQAWLRHHRGWHREQAGSDLTVVAQRAHLLPPR
jgi:hypothetical protein